MCEFLSYKRFYISHHSATKTGQKKDFHMHMQGKCTVELWEATLSFRGQLHFHGSPTDIGHSSIYGKCQGSCGVWGGGGNIEKVSDLRMRHRFLSG